MTTSPLMDIALLKGHAPFTLAGFSAFRSVIDSDGASPARLKALFTAVAAVDRRHLGLARREIERGAALGLTATAGMIVLTSLRREAAAIGFAEILGTCFEDLQAPDPKALPIAEAGKVEANFLAYFGTIPAPLKQLLRLSPGAADIADPCRFSTGWR